VEMQPGYLHLRIPAAKRPTKAGRCCFT